MEPVGTQRGRLLEDVAHDRGQELVTFAFLLTRDAGLAQDVVQGALARLTEHA